MNTDEIIQKQLAKMPKEVRQVIESDTAGAVLRMIAENHRLHIDQADSVGKEALLVLIGLTSMKEFMANIIKEAKLDPTTASQIAEEVSAKIFHPIREHLHADTAPQDVDELAPPSDQVSGLEPTEVGTLPPDWQERIKHPTPPPAPKAGDAIATNQLLAAQAKPISDPYREPIPEKEMTLKKDTITPS